MKDIPASMQSGVSLISRLYFHNCIITYAKIVTHVNRCLFAELKTFVRRLLKISKEILGFFYKKNLFFHKNLINGIMCVESLRKISKIYNNENAKCQMIAIANKTLSINGANIYSVLNWNG